MTRVAITGAAVFDGSGTDPIPGQTIIWEASHISWIGPDDEAQAADALLIPAEGGTVLPGLIDSHVHISLPPTITGVEDVADEPAERTAIRAAHHATLLLQAGITTARDVGSRSGIAIDVAQAQAAGDIQCARILAAGRGITSPGGHGMTLSVIAQGADEYAAAARAEIQRGARVIKLFPTGGVLGPGAHGYDVTMSLDEMKAATETAHELGVMVAAHVHGPEGVDLALEAGVDTIEHGTAATRDQCGRMADQGVALVPTLMPIEAILQREEEIPRALFKRAVEVSSVQAESVAAAIESGVTVLPGTDAGTPFNPPGNLVREMEILAELGLGNQGVLAAATGRAAEVFGLQDIGILAIGALADLLLVNGDPLVDLSVLSWPAAIVQDGVVL